MDSLERRGSNDSLRWRGRRSIVGGLRWAEVSGEGESFEASHEEFVTCVGWRSVVPAVVEQRLRERAAGHGRRGL